MVNRPALYASPGPAHSPACMKRLLPFLLAAGPPALVLLLALAMVVVGAPAGMTATTMATMADMADCTDDTDTTAAAATGTTKCVWCGCRANTVRSRRPAGPASTRPTAA